LTGFRGVTSHCTSLILYESVARCVSPTFTNTVQNR
jgi:hypothetical protein